MTDLLMIESKTIDSMMTDLKMTDSIERLIVVEKLLIELIRTYVDAFEINSITIEK